MKQKILCIILSAALCLTQAAPAFAVQSFDATGTSNVSVLEPYDTVEDAESVPSEEFSNNSETVSNAWNFSAEIVDPDDELGKPSTTSPEPASKESDSADAEIDSTVPSPIIDKVAAESEQDEELVGATIGLGVESHTQSQIKSYLKSSGVAFSAKPTYNRTPNTAAGSYDPGALSSASLQNSLGAINLVRYIAGLSYDVTLDNTYTKKAQAASFINYLNGKIEHYPPRPADVSDDLYTLGCQGAACSNLGWGTYYDNLGPV